MRITVIKKGKANAKPVAYCDIFIDDPPWTPKK
jgi:hypothetical protein